MNNLSTRQRLVRSAILSTAEADKETIKSNAATFSPAFNHTPRRCLWRDTGIAELFGMELSEFLFEVAEVQLTGAIPRGVSPGDLTVR